MKSWLHFLILAFLTMGILLTGKLSEFQTPFTGRGSDYDTPYETFDLMKVLGKDQYTLKGPFGREASSIHDCYIQPITKVATGLTVLFKYRVELSFTCALLGILLIVISRFYLRPAKSIYTLCHFLFCLIAFGVTLCNRWWGYG